MGALLVAASPCSASYGPPKAPKLRYLMAPEKFSKVDFSLSLRCLAEGNRISSGECCWLSHYLSGETAQFIDIFLYVGCPSPKPGGGDFLWCMVDPGFQQQAAVASSSIITHQLFQMNTGTELVGYLGMFGRLQSDRLQSDQPSRNKGRQSQVHRAIVRCK